MFPNSRLAFCPAREGSPRARYVADGLRVGRNQPLAEVSGFPNHDTYLTTHVVMRPTSYSQFSKSPAPPHTQSHDAARLVPLRFRRALSDDYRPITHRQSNLLANLGGCDKLPTRARAQRVIRRPETKTAAETAAM